MAEKNQITDRCRELVKQYGGKVIKSHGSPMTEVGTPDLLGVFMSVMLAVECKRPKKKPSPIQRKRLVEWGQGYAGAVAIKVDTVQQFRAVLDAMRPVSGVEALVSGSIVERALDAAETAGAMTWRQLVNRAAFQRANGETK